MKSLLYALLCLLGSLALACPAQAQENARTIIFQQGRDGYQSTQDTFVMSGSPDRNRDGADEWEWDGEDAGGRNFGLIQFADIVGEGENQIPPGANIVNAELVTQISNSSSGGDTATVYRVLSPWQADEVTYEALFGDLSAEEDPLPGDVIGETGIEFEYDPSNAGQVFHLELTELVQEIAEGGENHGFVIIPPDTSTNGFGHVSSEVGSFGDLPAPRLDIETDLDLYSFQYGLNGYTSSVDTYISNDGGNDFIQNFGDDDTMELMLGAADEIKMGLLRFNDLFGAQAGQITPAEEIRQATLSLAITETADQEAILREILPYTATFGTLVIDTNFAENEVTYENFVDNGFVVMPGVEVSEEPTASFTPDMTGLHQVDVTSSVQKWHSGELENYGWLIEAGGDDQVEIATKEWESLAPQLVVEFESSATQINDYILY